MLTEIKRHIAQLAETNRALVDDLDASRRIAAELGRERDALQAHVSRLQEELERQRHTVVTEQRGQDERARQELARGRQEADDLRREREALQRDAESAESRAQLLEQRLEQLTAELLVAEDERDELRAQLQDSTGTMDEILSCLEQVTPGAGPTGKRHLHAV
jgi:chromosome segregation ATPase